MSAEAMRDIWRTLVEPAVGGTRHVPVGVIDGRVVTWPVDYHIPPERRPVEPRRGDPDFFAEEEPTWPGSDSRPTVEKGDDDDQC